MTDSDVSIGKSSCFPISFPSTKHNLLAWSWLQAGKWKSDSICQSDGFTVDSVLL
jgi:hypothetical protein